MNARRVKVDTDVLGVYAPLSISASLAAVDDGHSYPKPRVFVTLAEGDIANAAHHGVEGLCMTPAQAARLGQALIDAARAARETDTRSPRARGRKP